VRRGQLSPVDRAVVVAVVLLDDRDAAKEGDRGGRRRFDAVKVERGYAIARDQGLVVGPRNAYAVVEGARPRRWQPSTTQPSEWCIETRKGFYD
jgi:hypothetical protein